MKINGTAIIHPSAVVEDGATIGPDCMIGPFAFVGGEVTLGRGVTVKSHAVITGWTEIGDETTVFSFATVGEVPQDLKYKGERTRLVVGARCRIREGATLNLGTEGGGGVTRVGDDCLIMTGAHVGHDAQIGNRVILVNHVAIAGHCVLGDDVIVGGLSGVYVEPVVEGDGYRFTVKVGTLTEAAKAGTKAAGRGENFQCVLSGTPIGGDYIKAEGQAGRMGARLM